MALQCQGLTALFFLFCSGLGACRAIGPKPREDIGGFKAAASVKRHTVILAVVVYQHS